MGMERLPTDIPLWVLLVTDLTWHETYLYKLPHTDMTTWFTVCGIPAMRSDVIAYLSQGWRPTGKPQCPTCAIGTARAYA